MRDYRAYLIGEDGHFVGAIDLVCPDDESAKQQARQLVGGHDFELWQEARIIGVFKKIDKVCN